jgi:hypothetical protein
MPLSGMLMDQSWSPMPSFQHIEIRLEDNIQLYECPAPDRARTGCGDFAILTLDYEGTFGAQ